LGAVDREATSAGRPGCDVGRQHDRSGSTGRRL